MNPVGSGGLDRSYPWCVLLFTEGNVYNEIIGLPELLHSNAVKGKCQCFIALNFDTLKCMFFRVTGLCKKHVFRTVWAGEIRVHIQTIK